MLDVNWINWLNTVSCLVLLFYLLAAGTQAGKWRHKLTLVPLDIVVAIQAIDPIAAWVPGLAWPAMLMNIALVFTVTIYRRELWHLIRAKFDPANAPRERAEDLRRKPA